jgi:hypothetical protein
MWPPEARRGECGAQPLEAEGGTWPPEMVEHRRRPGTEEGGERPLEATDHGRNPGTEKGGCVQRRAVGGGDVRHNSGGEQSSEAPVE